MFKGIHLSIEGMDGVGKTTICQMFEDRLGFKYIDKPLRYLFDDEGDYDTYIRIRDRVNKDPNRVFTSWFYGLGNAYLYDRFDGEKIVTDRHFLSNYIWSGEKESEPIFNTLLDVLGAPVLTVVLYARPEVINNRLVKRNLHDSDLPKVIMSGEKYEKMLHFLEKHDMPYISIDTSDKSPEGVYCIILNRLKELGAI